MSASPTREATGFSPERPALSALLTFGGVGIAATVCYFIAAAVISTVFPTTATLASVTAYFLSALLSYFGHKYLSFVSVGAHSIEAPRFVVASTLGLLLAYLVPLYIESIGGSELVAYGVVCLAVPVLNFILLKSWVFRNAVLPEGSLSLGQAKLLLGWPLAVGCLGMVIQKATWPTNPDTSWLITVIERMNSGDRLYTAIIELNPPGSIWLYWLPVKLAHFLALSPEAAVDAYTFLICLASVAITGWIISAGKLINDHALRPILAMMFFSAVALVGNSFSERDHIGVVLLVPLIALATWRSTGPTRPGPRHWLVAGVAGGVIAMVKPYYALIVIVVAGFVVVKRRDARLFFLPEFLLAGMMNASYIAVAYIVYPEFYVNLLPLLRETYMAFSQPFGLLATVLVPLLALPLVYAIFARRGGRTALADLLTISAGAALIPFLVQGKGWPYHAYPAVYLGSVSVIVAACTLIFQPHSSVQRPLAVREIAGLLVIALLAAHLRFLPDDAPPRSFAALIRAETAASTVGMLGGDIAAGHPLTRMIGGRWIEPYCSDWIATYAVRLKGGALHRGDSARAAYFQAMMNRYLAEKRGRLEKSPPEILIVDRTDGLVAMMLAEHGFSKLLANYTKLANYERSGSDGQLEVYRLTSMSPAM